MCVRPPHTPPQDDSVFLTRWGKNLKKRPTGYYTGNYVGQQTDKQRKSSAVSQPFFSATCQRTETNSQFICLRTLFPRLISFFFCLPLCVFVLAHVRASDKRSNPLSIIQPPAEKPPLFHPLALLLLLFFPIVHPHFHTNFACVFVFCVSASVPDLDAFTSN